MKNNKFVVLLISALIIFNIFSSVKVNAIEVKEYEKARQEQLLLTKKIQEKQNYENFKIRNKNGKSVGGLISVGLATIPPPLYPMVIAGAVFALGGGIIATKFVADELLKEQEIKDYLANPEMAGISEDGQVALSSGFLDKIRSSVGGMKTSLNPDSSYTIEAKIQDAMGWSIGPLSYFKNSNYSTDSKYYLNKYFHLDTIISDETYVRFHFCNACGVEVIPSGTYFSMWSTFTATVDRVGADVQANVDENTDIPVENTEGKTYTGSGDIVFTPPSLNLSKPKYSEGQLSPNGQITPPDEDKEEEKPPYTPDLDPDFDIDRPEMTEDYIQIMNYSNGKKITPYEDKINVKSNNMFVDILIHGQSYARKKDITQDDEAIEQKIKSSISVSLGDKDVDNVTFKEFSWTKRPSDITVSDYMSFKVLVKVPYPVGKINGDRLKVFADVYNGKETYKTLTHILYGMGFSSVNDNGQVVDPEPPSPPDDNNGSHTPMDWDDDGDCDVCHKEIDEDGNHKEDSGDNGGNEDGGSMPEFPKPPIGDNNDNNIGAWVKYLVDVLLWFFKILIWAITRPFVFLFDCITTLSGYISSALSVMSSTGKDIANVLSWLPDDITNILFGMFSLIITFCSVKMFKNFSNK